MLGGPALKGVVGGGRCRTPKVAGTLQLRWEVGGDSRPSRLITIRVDAEAPSAPRGCIAQVWSVAEMLRCWALTE